MQPRSTRGRRRGPAKVARNLTRSFFEIGHKRCNSNNHISMFKIGSGELRATFLGNHTSEATEQHDNTARHYANEQRAATHQHGGHHTRYEALHLLRDTAPLTRRYTRYEAPHPARGAAPVTRRYTRYEALHPLRSDAPDQKRCTAYGSGAHPITRTNAESARRSPTRTRPQELAQFNEVLRRWECDTHKAPGARAPGAAAQSQLSRRSTSRRRGRR